MGFSPVMSVSVARNWSNIAIYDTQTVGLSLSVKSNF